MQYNGQTNNQFGFWWNNYKDNNQKSLRGEGHKQAATAVLLMTLNKIY